MSRLERMLQFSGIVTIVVVMLTAASDNPVNVIILGVLTFVVCMAIARALYWIDDRDRNR